MSLRIVLCWGFDKKKKDVLLTSSEYQYDNENDMESNKKKQRCDGMYVKNWWRILKNVNFTKWTYVFCII